MARGAEVAGELCLRAIAFGDGREVFTRGNHGELISSASGRCLSMADDSLGGKLAMGACPSAVEAHDRRTSWELSASGELKAIGAGGLCVGFAASQPSVQACAGAEETIDGARKLFFVAVPAFDAGPATSVKYGAVLLTAAASRQQKLLSKLQGLLPRLESCKEVAALASNTSTTLSLGLFAAS